MAKKKENKQATDNQPKFSIELFNTICNDIANSSNGLKVICKQHGVSASSFYLWIKQDGKLLDSYTRAREDQADFMADEIIAIADDGSKDTEIRFTSSGEPYDAEDKEWTSRSKLRVEARKWLAAKLKPKKYGDSSKVEMTIREQPLLPD